MIPIYNKECNDNTSSHPITNSISTHVHVPIPRSVDKPSPSLPMNISMSEEFMCTSIGFR